jgi:hypothetical protein
MTNSTLFASTLVTDYISSVTNLTLRTTSMLIDTLPSNGKSTIIGYDLTSKQLCFQPNPFVWGSFSSTASQPVGGANTTTLASYDTSNVTALNCSYSGAAITVSVACSKIRIQSSLIVTSGANNTTFRFWLVKVGVGNLPNTGSTVIVKDSGDQTLEVCEWYDSCVAGDQYAIAFQADKASASIIAVGAGGTAPNDYPASPSIITTVMGFP